MSCAELGDCREKLSKTEKHGKEVAYAEGASPFATRTNYMGRRHVRKLLAMAILAASITACSKTKEGDLEVEKPVIGTVTDTLNVPSVDITTDSMMVKVPKVEVKK